MRIAIDISALRSGHKVRGIGVMVDQQIKAIKDLKDKSIKLEAVDFSKANLDKYDIVHYPYFFPYFETLPKRLPKARIIVTIQDLIYLVFPDKYPPGLSGRIIFRRQKQRIKDVNSIVTVSETSKEDIFNFLKIDKEKIDVIYLAHKEIFKPIKNKKRLNETKEKYNLPNDFVLYVGDVNFNKNIITLVKACEKGKLNLVIVGKQASEIEDMGIKLDNIQGPMDWLRYVFNIPHPELEHFRELTEVIKGAKNIIRTGYVSEEELVDIYNLATIYCQPSLYEGFGFPLLEAMACNTPVVASKIRTHMEIAGKAATFFEPENFMDLSKKLTELKGSKNKRELLVKRGSENVKNYSWKKYAKEMIEVYKKVYVR